MIQEQFKAVSLSFQNTPISIRELFSFDESGVKRILLCLKERFDLQEALFISTCNRTELYYVSEIDLNNQIIDYFVEQTDIAKAGEVKQYFLKFNQSLETIYYLFEVSIGLHSQVIGDLQIIGQAKLAYQWSADVNMAGAFLHRLMHSIFYANKKIVQETNYRDGAASISYAAAELIDEILISNKNKTILLVGTGEIGEDISKNLINFGYTNITICNRTLENAQNLATKLNFDLKSVLPYELLWSHIAYFDVIISAVQVAEPLFTFDKLKDLKVYSHKNFIDVSMPRSIDISIEKIPGIVLYNLEDLNKKTSKALELRLAAVPKVKQIINETIEEFASWVKETEVSPTIHRIKLALETIRQEEINRFNKQLTEKELKAVETITKNMVQKLIKLPVVQLKAACKRGDAENLIEVLTELFDLEKQSELK